jgi:hypothetical protein
MAGAGRRCGRDPVTVPGLVSPVIVVDHVGVATVSAGLDRPTITVIR